MSESSINSLLENLKNLDENVRQQATEELWRLWFYQKGISGMERLGRTQILLERGETAQAEARLTQIISTQGL